MCTSCTGRFTSVAGCKVNQVSAQLGFSRGNKPRKLQAYRTASSEEEAFIQCHELRAVGAEEEQSGERQAARRERDGGGAHDQVSNGQENSRARKSAPSGQEGDELPGGSRVAGKAKNNKKSTN